MNKREEQAVMNKFDDAVLAVLQTQPVEKPDIPYTDIRQQLPSGMINEMGMLKCHQHIDSMMRANSMIYSSLQRLELLGKVLRLDTERGWGCISMSFMAKDVPLEEIVIPQDADMQKDVMSMLIKRIVSLEKRLADLENK